jgi:hypothetical protein
MFQNKEWQQKLNASINRGDFLLFLSPNNTERYDFLVANLTAEYQPLIHAAFYVFQDEKMIQELYEAVPASVKGTIKS